MVVKVKVAQSCLTLCDHMDCSPPGSSVHGDFPGQNTRVAYHFLLQTISGLLSTIVKNQPADAADAGDVGLIPGTGRSPRERNGNPLQYPHLENPMYREAWWATVHGVTESQTQLSTPAQSVSRGHTRNGEQRLALGASGQKS